MNTVQLRRLTVEACDGPFGSAIKTDHYSDDGARVVRLGNIGGAEWIDDDAAFLELGYFTELQRHSVLGGDLLIAGLGDDRNPVGRAAVAPVGIAPALVKADCYRFRLRDADARFVAYFLSSTAGIAQSAQLADGSTRKRLTLGKALGLRVPDVPEPVQRAIADYLDTETARIDALITKKQQLIHLLEERDRIYRTSIMTGGIGSEPRLTTGTLLTPELPVGWRLMRMRHLVERIVDTPHKTAPVIDGERFLVVRTANVKKGHLVMDKARFTDEASWREWNRRGTPRVGDVLFTREAPAGEACLVPAGQDLCMGQRMVLLQVNEQRTTGRWLLNSIYAGPAQRFIQIHANATTVAHLNMSDIPDIPVAVPPLKLQASLLAQLGARVAATRRAMGALEEQCRLLAEHRTAVITRAVAGNLETSV